MRAVRVTRERWDPLDQARRHEGTRSDGGDDDHNRDDELIEAQVCDLFDFVGGIEVDEQVERHHRCAQRGGHRSRQH